MKSTRQTSPDLNSRPWLLSSYSRRSATLPYFYPHPAGPTWTCTALVLSSGSLSGTPRSRSRSREGDHGITITWYPLYLQMFSLHVFAQYVHKCIVIYYSRTFVNYFSLDNFWKLAGKRLVWWLYILYSCCKSFIDHFLPGESPIGSAPTNPVCGRCPGLSGVPRHQVRHASFRLSPPVLREPSRPGNHIRLMYLPRLRHSRLQQHPTVPDARRTVVPGASRRHPGP